MWLIVSQADPDVLAECRRLRRRPIHSVEMQAQVLRREAEPAYSLRL